MIRRFSANARDNQPSTRSALPISARVAITASFAPPCNGPLSAPTAAVTAL